MYAKNLKTCLVKNKIIYRNEARIKIQKTIRMWLAVRKFRPMYRGLTKVTKLRIAIDSSRAIVESMKGSSSSKATFNKEVDNLYAQMKILISDIKSGKLKKTAEIEAGYRKLVSAVEVSTKALQSKKKEIEEQERLAVLSLPAKFKGVS